MALTLPRWFFRRRRPRSGLRVSSPVGYRIPGVQGRGVPGVPVTFATRVSRLRARGRATAQRHLDERLRELGIPVWDQDAARVELDGYLTPRAPSAPTEQAPLPQEWTAERAQAELDGYLGRSGEEGAT